MKEVLRNLKVGTIFDLDDSMYKTRYFVLEQCETGTKIMTLHIPTDWIVGWKYGETVDYNKSNVNRELKKIMEKKEAVTGSDCFIPHKIQYSDEATWEGKLRVLTCEEAVKYNDIIVTASKEDTLIGTQETWLCTPGEEEKNWIKILDMETGKIKEGPCNKSYFVGVYPVCILNSLIEVETV